jgi:hypothetical protein
MPLYSRAKKKFLDGDIDLLVDDLKVRLLDLNDIGTAITGVTNESPAVLTATSHGRPNGARVAVVGVGGTTAVNRLEALIAGSTANTFTLTDLDGNPINGNGAYTSGGRVIDLDTPEFASELTSAVVAISGNLASKTTSVTGVFDASDITLTSVSGDPIEAFEIIKDTGTPSTSARIYLGFRNSAGTDITFTPNGGDCAVTWNAAGIFWL